MLAGPVGQAGLFYGVGDTRKRSPVGNQDLIGAELEPDVDRVPRLQGDPAGALIEMSFVQAQGLGPGGMQIDMPIPAGTVVTPAWHEDQGPEARSEEHTSELQSLMRISYAVF